jgi:lipid-binding SYLF domain-containing protein
MAGSPSLWIYRSADAHAAVDATDYFTNGRDLGMKVGDVVIVVITTTELATIHAVLAIDDDGNASISAGTFA